MTALRYENYLLESRQVESTPVISHRTLEPHFDAMSVVYDQGCRRPWSCQRATGIANPILGAGICWWCQRLNVRSAHQIETMKKITRYFFKVEHTSQGSRGTFAGICNP